MKINPDWVPEGHQVFHPEHDHPITFSQNQAGRVSPDKCTMGCSTRINRDGSIGVNHANNYRYSGHLEAVGAGTHDTTVGYGNSGFYTFGASKEQLPQLKSIEQTKEEKKSATYDRKKLYNKERNKAIRGTDTSKPKSGDKLKPGPKIKTKNTDK